MIGELNVGHAYYYGGDTDGQPYTSVGMLGADYSVADVIDRRMTEYTGFRIDKLYEGAAWDSDARNPLNAHGLDIGRRRHHHPCEWSHAVDTSKDPWASFIGLAGTRNQPDSSLQLIPMMMVKKSQTNAPSQS